MTNLNQMSPSTNEQATTALNKLSRYFLSSSFLSSSFLSGHMLQVVPTLKAATIGLLVLWLSACSLQHHIDKAEHQWLQAKSLQTAMHQSTLVPMAVKNNANPFASATSVSTYLTGQLSSRKIRELSGLAAVRGSKNLYWAINDSGNRPELYIVSDTGDHVATISVPAVNVDWEDLASFDLNGESWLVVADTGDNLHRRANGSLYFFKQPDVTALPLTMPVHHRLDFTYPNRAENIESVAVSVTEQRIYLIGKELNDAKIYALPLKMQEAGAVLTATQVGVLATLKPTADDKWWEKRFAQQYLLAPTGMDISSDNRTAVIANYRHSYMFQRNLDESWAQALSGDPQVITTHRMKQSEAVAFSSAADRVIVSSEGVSAPILSVVPDK